MNPFLEGFTHELEKEAKRYRKPRMRRPRKPKKLSFRKKLVGALSKAYTSPTFWTITGGAMGAGGVYLSTKKTKSGKVVSRMKSRPRMALTMGALGAGMAAGEAVLDRVMFGKAFRQRKAEKKLTKMDTLL